jgi:hypothetical protein
MRRTASADLQSGAQAIKRHLHWHLQIQGLWDLGVKVVEDKGTRRCLASRHFPALGHDLADNW